MGTELVTNVVSKTNLRKAQLNAFRIAAETLTCAFGPYASTTAIRHGETEKDQFGGTTYTKDGHTILKSLLINRPIEMSAIEDLKRITSETVKKVGDGTTSATILSYIIYQWLTFANNKFGIPESRLVRDLQSTTKQIIDLIETKKRPCTSMDIFEIAIISTNGNVEVSNAIKQLYEKHGMGVFIDVGISNTEEHVVKEYDGLTFDQGYYNAGFINNEAKGTCEIDRPKIYVFEDPVDTPSMRTFFDKILYDNIWGPLSSYASAKQQGKETKVSIVPTVIFSPAYGHDMKSMADDVMARFGQFPVNQKPPFLSVTNIHDKDALSDLCTLTGARLIKKYQLPEEEKEDQERGLAPTLETIHEFSGTAGRVVADAAKTKVVDPGLMFVYNSDGEIEKDENGNPVHSNVYENLVNACELQLKQLENEHKELTQIYLLKKRINSLKGNMVEYLVGGVSTSDRDSVKDLVEDAVLNCRSAAAEGVGYGANFEALRALNTLAKKESPDKAIDPNTQYSMVSMLLDAYTTMAQTLYKSALDGNSQEALQLVALSVAKDRPCNLAELVVTSDGAGGHNITDAAIDAAFNEARPVLSSIKSDEVILNAISKIIGVTFATNQYFVQDPRYNIYEDAPVVATAVTK